MRNDFYPSGTVQALLLTDLVQQNTIAVLNNRLEKEETIVPLFFDIKTFAILQAVCERLIPQPERIAKIDLAGLLDEQLFSGAGNGWRYNKMPPDNQAFSLGFIGIDETAELMFGQTFKNLEETEQDEVLAAIQSSAGKGKTWEQMPSDLFFEELLTSIVELYYSHPLAKEEIGDISFADAKGWQHIGLNELEAYQPIPVKSVENDK